MRKLGIITALFVLLLSSFTGCGSSPLDKKVKKEEAKRTEEKNGPKLTKMSTESFNQSISQEAKKKVLAMEEIIKTTAVNSNLDLYIAVKPEHHERFGLKPLRTKIKKQLSDEYPTFNIQVSTDRKIFMLLDNLENKIKKKEVNKDQIKKQLKLIQSEVKSDT
ncbi:hypothetical protein COM13_18530 [Bacillus pseudomycoides]|uniref:YhcN/YlaJ family sporulation lipoprotein n=1 Tax=Bacillus pseudomycoides TaxID=64104 RepID=UPI000BEE033B|nr:YhcN/YlaJ family sporulation lipoprotein [Bacillus pseudomycoides]PDY00377.1 hypothetical protein COO07_10940 [Bacillus pseudomycoides]PEK80666.1 hypothetical protein CN597_09625 [Bacillus pseudomycoides]PEN08190.1 hypothetical protein CN640_14260 [Bacillus pseudomycoides]PGB87465.1 hypothetical protein COM13_18530 [Bacillus pseudomycoides]PHE58176.1 hypothetical protein COF52_04405 [Bacillus pseudomycoides]